MTLPIVERLRDASTFCGPLSDVNHLFEEAAETIETLKRQRLDTDMVENAARAIRNRAEQPIDMAEARYLARAALDASGIGEMVEALDRGAEALSYALELLEDLDECPAPIKWCNALDGMNAALSRARATVGNKDE
jgi:hypothetical protein